MIPLIPLLPDATTLAAFSLAAVLLILTPGPDMTLFVSRAIVHGRAAGVATVIGTSLGLILHTLLAGFGLSALLAASPNAFALLKMVGAIYLAWLAIEMIRKGSALSTNTTPAEPMPLWRHAVMGLGINLLNPKIVIFFLTFLPQFVAVDDPLAGPRMMVLGGIYVILGFPICAAMALGAGGLAGFLKRHAKVARLLDWATATLFASFAARLLFARATP
jgi:threonine/homoserine/homoserine lactone efflux protein